MIERYSRPEMARLWSDEHRLLAMLEVETVFLEALAKDKRIPAAEIRALKDISPAKILQEARRQEAGAAHEIVGLLWALSRLLGTKAPRVRRYLHYGLTSSDVLDTALALQLRDSADLLLEGWRQARGRIAALARRHEKTWMAGRTHGVHAEPMTFGVKLAGWHAQVLRDEARLKRAREEIRYGKISGAIGTFTQIGPRYEAQVCRALGLKPEPVSTQVVPRDRHAEFVQALVLSAAAVERFALEIRHLQKTETLEAEEPFSEGQKGSSAMPHKKNPVLCENLCGLARLVRSYGAAAAENVALWHERDISHSSVERVILADACLALDFMLHRLAKVLGGLAVYPERMKKNMDASRGLVFSQRVLLRLIDAGLGRQEAYDLTQAAAMACWRTGKSFEDCLAENPEVLKALSRRGVAECFDLESYRKFSAFLLRRGGVKK
ncbi:MAG TPA: adenylosuccinate lyase [Elusimicrobiota bacterium]|nr:adenylosuccinate lyase [Elusimicrobiota bacterium]